MNIEDYLLKIGVALSEVVARNSYGAVSTKMEQARTKKTLEDQQLAYEDIINNLLQDKMELEGIARQYKDSYEKITISDEDIEYLHRTISSATQVLGALDPNFERNRASVEALSQLINKDVLKTMQLLGFNYKEAIGEPLTKSCAAAIKNKLGG